MNEYDDVYLRLKRGIIGLWVLIALTVLTVIYMRHNTLNQFLYVDCFLVLTAIIWRYTISRNNFSRHQVKVLIVNIGLSLLGCVGALFFYVLI